MNLERAHERWSALFYAALLMLAIVAFWPGYIAVPKLELSGWTHFHAVTGTLWLLLLIAQPWAIGSGRRSLHILLGRASYVLAPLVVVGFVGLSHSSMQGKSPQGQAVDAFFLYIRFVLLAIFVGTYMLGAFQRTNREVHSRYMLCTGLPLIDPVAHRIAHRVTGDGNLNFQLLTFGVACAILVFLISVVKRPAQGRRALSLVLAAFIVGGMPIALDFYTWGAPWTYWKAVAKLFADLPLT